MTSELNAAEITKGLKTGIIGRQIIYLPSVGSTMDAAREEALKGAAAGVVVIAGEQTAGRGRLKRHWLAPAGNIALSIILRPELKDLPYLVMIASLAAAQSITGVTGRATQIKWPNDVLIDGKKVCGILIENELRGDKVGFSIIGIGINVNINVAEHIEIADTAASLDDTSGAGLRIKLIRSLLNEFDALYRRLPDGKAIYEAWRASLVTLGKHVKVVSGDQIIEGIAASVDEDGALVIRGADGEVTKVVAGDVTLKVK